MSARAFVTATVISLALALTPRDARADACATRARDAGAPVRAPGVAASLGAVPEACPVASADLVLTGRALVAADDFYGSVFAEAALEARLTLPRRMFVSVHVPGLAYRFVANATVESSDVVRAPGAVGFHLARALARRVTATPFVRALVPVDSGFESATRVGFDTGLSIAARLGRAFELVGGYALPVLTTVVDGRGRTTAALTTAADLVWRPRPWLALAAGLDARFAFAPNRLDPLGRSDRADDDASAFESLAPRASARVFPGRHVFADLSVAAPLAGRDRTDVAASLRVGWLGR